MHDRSFFAACFLALMGAVLPGATAARDLPSAEEERKREVWATAEDHLEHTGGAQLAIKVAIYPQPYGRPGDLQVIDLGFTWPATAEHPRRWWAHRRVIDSRRLDAAPPDADLSAFMEQVTVFEATDSDSCVNLDAQIEALEPLLQQPFDLPGAGKPGPSPQFRIGADTLVLTVQGAYANGLHGWVKFTQQDDGPQGPWMRSLAAALAPCWKPDPDVEP